MILYILIFLAKVLENALATIRLILVAHNKKKMGAFLQLLITLIWIIVAGSVLVNITDDWFKVFAFAFGSMVGSYVGSLIEERMAMGNNSLMAIVEEKIAGEICAEVRKYGYAVTSLMGKGKNDEKTILYIIVSRKKQNEVVEIIDRLDPNSMIVTENVSTIKGGLIM